MSTKAVSLFDRQILRQAVLDSFRKLGPRTQLKNPVMAITLIGALLTFEQLFTSTEPFGYVLQVALWLLFTVIFANFAEAVAEGRGKAQADTLKRARTQTFGRRLRDGRETKVSATDLRQGDNVVCETGDIIPADGDVIDGIASVDESAITGESAPVVRESGGDRCAVTGGTRVLSDRIVIRVTSEPGHTFIDRMIAMVEGATRQKTPNEIALTILLSALTIIFLLVVIALKPFGIYANVAFSITTLIALLVCLIPTTIGGLLSAIGIAGMDRLLQRNVLATSGRAVEAAGDIDVLLLDKTGTITLGNRQASDFVPAPGVTRERLAGCRPTRLARRRDARGPQHRRSRQGKIRPPWPRTRATARRLRTVHRANPHERRRPRTRRRQSGHAPDPEGRRRQRQNLGRVTGRHLSRRRHRGGGFHFPPRRYAPRRRRRPRGARRHPPEGRRQRWHQGTLRPAPRHGHPHSHDSPATIPSPPPPSPPKPAWTISSPRPRPR